MLVVHLSLVTLAEITPASQSSTERSSTFLSTLIKVQVITGDVGGPGPGSSAIYFRLRL